ncbi:PadR family transcriptional regulator [Bacillus sp. B-jedd]|uniref:PadR family transcriptional regulator n=1 Tax=Bacillus sp. B-jedd TaxID=1476857 RepID=UPI00051554C7|nr:PadR family transcriptional regulator [Bacillus sp. B-jedd]CEG26639.1 transcriptional regulator PadR-like family protein [Bacillus sp. B-jedd]
MSIEHSILAVISFKPSSGYDIKAEFEHEGAGLFWGMSYGSIYPKLKQLEEAGLIEALENNPQGRRRVLYDLTPKGWKELDDWLLQSPDYPVIKDELFMKIAAWHDEMASDRLIGHLENRREKSLEILHFVKSWPENGSSYVSGIGKLAIEHAKSRLESEIDWIDKTISLLKKGDLPEAQDPDGMAEKIRKRRMDALKRGRSHEK